MELLDVLDKNGNKTGIIKSRDDVHRDGDWHRHVHIWIINSKGELLLQKRSPNKDTYPNMWAMSCEGHVSSGDDSLMAAIRELKEELGATIGANDIEFLFDIVREKIVSPVLINRSINDVYLIKSDINIASLLLQEDEVSEVRWVNYRDFEQIIENKDPDFRQYGEEVDRFLTILRARYS